MKKRLLSALVCAALVFGLAAAGFAAEANPTVEEAAQVLSALDIMTGDENGDLHLGKTVTRAEFTKLTVAASAWADSVGPAASVSPYPDVPKSSWAAPYVQVAKEKGMVMGSLSGYFEPDRNITLVEGVTMVLRLLGYQDSDFSGAWGSGQMAMYQSLKLDKNISAGRDDAMTRQDALWLFYHLLTAKNKSGQVYLATLGHTLTAAGEIDRVALVNSAMEGPLVAEGNWQASLPFAAATAKVYRNGKAGTLADVQSLDVVYYSKPMRSLWAWSNKVTGSIQKISPSASSPTSVTVGGQPYTLETSSAAYALSDLGAFQTGDTVTLLLGRSGGVAAVRTPGESAGMTYGVVTGTGNASYQDKDGKSYTASTVYVTATDGNPYSYQWEDKNRKFEAGDMVQITAGDDGFQLKKLSATSLTGRVNTGGTALGGYDFASDVEILDTCGDGAALRVYPSRLAGVSFKDKMVRYYVLNENGEISRMILSDVTGDIHQYGVLTDVTESALGMTLLSSYVYDVAGVPGAYTSKTSIWNLEKGPCQIKMDGKEVGRIYNLTGAELTAVDGNTAVAGARQYTLSDSVAVYELRNKKYYLTDLSRVTGGGYDLTGWYDKAASEGGRIRVIIAEAE